MFSKSLCLLISLTFLGACSHGHGHQKFEKPVHKPKMAKSFMDVIKTKKPGKPQGDKRVPASTKNTVPGLKEFIAALKANPNFLKAPIGYEVVKSNSGTYEGQVYKTQEKYIFLKEHNGSHFSLENYDDSPEEFNLYESDRVEDIDSQIRSQNSFKEFKKLSATKFLVTFEFSISEAFQNCQMELDLSKSSELGEFSCKDANGTITSETKLVSVTAIKPQDYAGKLKAAKLIVHPKGLDCGVVTVEGGEEQDCYSSVTDDAERDWSYLLK